MGSFGYICNECKSAIRSGERCVIFLLDKGKIVEYQNGTYDEFGSIEELDSPDISSSGEKWKYKNWNELVNMHFGDNDNSGFSCYHEACYKDQIPTTRSADDPRQSWGNTRVKFLNKKNIFKHMPEKLKKELMLLTL